MNIHLRHGRVIDPKQGFDGLQDLFIRAGRIAGRGEAPSGFVADQVIDAHGLIVCPGLVDLSARLREPGLEYKATLATELQAAIAGGVTHVACPPDTDPALDEPGLVKMLTHRARSLALAHVCPVGALTVKLEGKQITEMAELRDAGCVAFSQVDQPLIDTQVLMRALQYAATFRLPVWLRAQDPYLARNGVAHEGEVATRLGLAGIPIAAETVALATQLLLVKHTGARVHFCRLSSAEALDMIRAAKAQGLPVSCDVGVHYLHLSDMDIGFFDSNCHVIPPFRSLSDRVAIRAALLDGTIDAICSDHTPVDDDAKLLPFGEAEAGTTGLELLLPLTLKWGKENALPLLRILAKITTDAAAILGLDAGSLAIGAPADVCVFDPESYWSVTPQTLTSSGKNTPFLGTELAGKVRYTLVNGQVVFAA